MSAEPVDLATRRWQSWNAVTGEPGPVHTRVDRPTGKAVYWPTDTRTGPLVYFATATHRPPAPLPGSALIVCEGEKAADAVAALGYMAAGTVCGAPSDPDDAVVKLLAGYPLALAPDNDAEGQRHMERLAGRLELAGVPKLYWIDPPDDAPEKWDLADADPDERRRIIRTARRLDLFEPGEREAIDAATAEAIGSTEPGCTTTVADLDADPGPGNLAAPYIAGRGTTVIYGRGGTGKGVTTCHLIARLVRDAKRVYVLDYEDHADEWAERLRAFGLTDDELRMVAYRTPYGEHWPKGVARGPLVKVAEYVRQDAAAFGAGVVVVDSYTTATSTGDANGGADSAQEFATASGRTGLPVVVLAHVPKSAERFPAYPFGSVFVHNLARMTWAVEALPSDDHDPDNPYAPQLVRLELRNQKRNRGGKHPAQFLTFSFYLRADESLERIETDTPEPDRMTIADMARAILDGPMTLPEIRKAIRDDFDRTIDEATIRRSLARSRDIKEDRTGKRPYRWSRS